MWLINLTLTCPSEYVFLNLFVRRTLSRITVGYTWYPFIEVLFYFLNVSTHVSYTFCLYMYYVYGFVCVFVCVFFLVFSFLLFQLMLLKNQWKCSYVKCMNVYVCLTDVSSVYNKTVYLFIAFLSSNDLQQLRSLGCMFCLLLRCVCSP